MYVLVSTVIANLGKHVYKRSKKMFNKVFELMKYVPINRDFLEVASIHVLRSV